MTFHSLGGDGRNAPWALAQRFEVGHHICGLPIGQAEVGHIGLRLHGGRRLDPMNQVLGVILKFAGDERAARNLIERRADYSVGVGNSGNDVAGAASELLDGRPPAPRGTGDRHAIVGNLSPSYTARQQSEGKDWQARKEQTNTHIDVRCGFERKSFSSRLLKTAEFSRFLSWRRAQASGNRRHESLRKARCRILRIAGRGLGLAFAALLAGSACFCQQSASPHPDGGQIFSHYCAKCHGQHGEGISAAVTYAGPSLQAEQNAGNVMTALEVGPGHMPRFQYVLSGDEMRAVSQYVAQKLAVIPLSGGNVSDGGELYRTYCSACHGPNVRGGALGYVGANAPSLENKSAALLAGAIRWGPGPMPSFPPSILTNEQVASIVDYIRVVQEPPNPGGNPMKWFGPTSEGFVAWVIMLVLVLFAIWAEWGGKG